MSERVVKDGVKHHKQNWLCKSCGRQFLGIKRLDNHRLYHEYVFGKQTLSQLAEKYGISHRTVRRHLDKIRSTRIISADKNVIVLMDTTYWGRNFGVVTFKDSRTSKILWRKFVRYETLEDYREGVGWLEEQGFQIDGIVCDGLRGMFAMLSRYRVQMCQVHQIWIIRRYLTASPELPASIELWDIVKMMTYTDKESFIGAFEEWSIRWKDFLSERYVDRTTGKSRYVHTRLRSAYLSLKRNMFYLWTWYDHIEVGIPNTNNALEGQFADLKTKLRNHNGLSKERRKIFIDQYFKNSF